MVLSQMAFALGADGDLVRILMLSAANATSSR
jgi:hypothetical protein